MTDKAEASVNVSEIGTPELEELVWRVQEIDASYRAVAEKVGQLYLRAGEQRLAGITEQLDKPMRNASENEQAFAALLDDLRMQRNQRH
jgi:hypothetical protein